MVLFECENGWALIYQEIEDCKLVMWISVNMPKLDLTVNDTIQSTLQPWFPFNSSQTMIHSTTQQIFLVYLFSFVLHVQYFKSQ